MNTVKENLLLHPVRLRLILAAAGRQVTAQQLAAELPDIPQATLYRQLNTLTDAGILLVVSERRVHNTIEKTYALPHRDLLLTVDDLKAARPADYIRLFTQFLGQLLGYFVRYAQRGRVNLARDHVLFQLAPAYLSPSEAQALGQAVNDVLRPYLAHTPAPDRQRFVLGILSLPDSAQQPRQD
jgi:DNA-binding transcriptional ArsR family regulator